MRLLRLLSGPNGTPRYRLALSAGLSGLCSTLVLAIVNMAAGEIASGSKPGVDWVLAALFAASVLIYFLADVYLSSRMTRDIEAALHGIRIRLLTLLRQADPVKLERFGETRLYESITRGSEAISRNAPYLATNFRSIILVLAVCIYIGAISLLALGLVIVVVAIAGWRYIRMAGETQARYGGVLREENRLFEHTGDLLDGFKEVRLNSRRSHDLGVAFERVSAEARQVGIDVQLAAFRQSTFGQVAFFFLLGIIVFVVPGYSQSFSEDVLKITTAALFMIGPLGSVIQSVTVLGAAEADATRMAELEGMLEGMREPEGEVPAAGLPVQFESLGLENLEFRYPRDGDEAAFTVGPLHATVKQGEIVFITGGNGAGKTTLVKLLSGIYAPQAGQVLWNGVAIGDNLRALYRERLSVVFSDFHLFRQFYGLQGFDRNRAEYLLGLMELDGVVELSASGFGRIDLSAGQRKRLALIAALLEDRPILILDEWAADQDPRFRQRFYREILPILRAEGRTLIAITHDDHYFDAADRCLHLDNGRFRDAGGGAG